MKLRKIALGIASLVAFAWLSGLFDFGSSLSSSLEANCPGITPAPTPTQIPGCQASACGIDVDGMPPCVPICDNTPSPCPETPTPSQGNATDSPTATPTIPCNYQPPPGYGQNEVCASTLLTTCAAVVAPLYTALALQTPNASVTQLTLGDIVQANCQCFETVCPFIPLPTFVVGAPTSTPIATATLVPTSTPIVSPTLTPSQTFTHDQACQECAQEAASATKRAIAIHVACVYGYKVLCAVICIEPLDPACLTCVALHEAEEAACLTHYINDEAEIADEAATCKDQNNCGGFVPF